MTNSRYFIRESEVAAYSPRNHTGTINRRLIGPETVGANQLEVVLGTIDPEHGALPHCHPGIEQVCYILEGHAVAEVNGLRTELGPGDCCFFPAGQLHTFNVTGDKAVRVLVIYSPPYMETPAIIV